LAATTRPLVNLIDQAERVAILRRVDAIEQKVDQLLEQANRRNNN
jgi:hypothetical protein